MKGSTARRSGGVGDPGWRDHAACRRLDPELFFPISTLGSARPQIEAAKQVCRSCPVRLTCLRWALVTGQDAGVWGGTTEQERRLLRRRVLISARAAAHRNGTVQRDGTGTSSSIHPVARA